MLGVNRKICVSGSILLAGTLLVSQAQAAGANDNSRRAMFHQFAAGHSDLSNREMRKSFRQELRSLQHIERAQSRIDASAGTSFDVSDSLSAEAANSLNRIDEPPMTPEHSLTQTDTGRVVKLQSGVNLDLGSSEKNITLGSNLFEECSSVTIQVGGESRTVQAGSPVTASEYVAVKQALSGGQKLSVDALGRADGGQIDFSAITGNGDSLRASNLVNPGGVTISADFGKHSDLQLLGDLENHGNIVAFSSSNSVKGGSIGADDITNYEGAVISTAGGVDLALHASGDFTNFGTVDSSGDLTVTAGGHLSNTTSGANRATMSAARNAYLNAPNVSNSGIIRAAGGVTVDAAGTLNFDNNFGSVEAASIILRAPGYGGTYDTNVYGGDFLSCEIQLNAGEGLFNLDAKNISGDITATGLAAHVVAATDDLNLGKICLTGDPTFYNTGNININGNITVAEALVIVAEGNITLTGGFDIVAANASQGFPVTLIAGADIIATAGGANQPNLGPIPPPNANNGGVTLNGLGTPGGGFINIGSGSTISTRPVDLVGNKNGADVLLVALSGAGVNTGDIVMLDSSTSISTAGTGLGDNGNITMIGDGFMTVRNLITGGAQGFGGNVLLNNARPVSSSGGNIVYQANGSLGANSNTWVPGAAPAAKDIAILNDVAIANAKLTVICGDDISLSAGVVARNVDLLAVGDCGLNFNCNIQSTGIVTINADTVRNISVIGQGRISAAFVTITSATNIGQPIGVGTGAINVEDSSSLVFNAGTDASFFFDNGIVVNPNNEGSIAQGDVKIIGNGGAVINGNINSINGDIQINADGGLTVGASSLIFAGNGNVALQESFGDILVQNGASIGSGTGLASLSIGNGGGQINVLDGVLIGGQTGTTLNNIAGGITIGASQIISTTGDTLLQTTGGAITLSTGSDVETLDGNLSIINGLDKKLDTIILQNGAKVSALGGAGFGNVLISIGAPDADIPGKAPKKNLVQNISAGGQIFFGKKSITANAPNNTLTAKGANIKFNNPISKKNIVLGGNVIIIADPPGLEDHGNNSGVPVAELRSRGRTTAGPVGVHTIVTPSFASSNLNSAPVESVEVSNLFTVNQLQSGFTASASGAEPSLTRKKKTDNSTMVTSISPSLSHSVELVSDRDFDGTASGSLRQGKELDIYRGNVLVYPMQDTNIETPLGTVLIGADSAVLMSADQSRLSIFNLDDRQKGKVSCRVAGKNISLAPGQHVTISASAASSDADAFAQINPFESISHRSLASQELGQSVTLYRSEFFIPSALSSVSCLKNVSSMKHEDAVRLTNRLIKNAAVIMHMTPGGESYRHYLRPQLAAWN